MPGLPKKKAGRYDESGEYKKQMRSQRVAVYHFASDSVKGLRELCARSNFPLILR